MVRTKMLTVLRNVLAPQLDAPFDVTDIRWGELTSVRCRFCNGERVVSGGADTRPVMEIFPHGDGCPVTRKDELLGRRDPLAGY